MKRTLIFALTYHPFIGGAEVAIKEITERLAPSDFEFHMVTLRFDKNLPRVEKLGNITVHRIGFSSPGAKVSDRSMPFRCKVAKALFPSTAFLKAVSLHRKQRFDVIWAMMANQAGFAALFFKWTHPHVPYFLELQDGRPFAQMKDRRPMLRLIWPLYRRIYLKADMIKCISMSVGSEARAIGYRGSLRVIPNGVDVAKFSAPVVQEKLDELKKKFGKQPGDIFLVTVSRLVLSRGVEDVIHALVELPPNVKCLIAGDGEDKEKLEHIARECGVFDRCIFAGHVKPSDVPAYLKISDIFVRPSIIEAFGNAFVEAFAAGIPIIGTPVGGIPDFLTDGETGLFCHVRDPASIARAVKRYLDEPELRAHVVANAKKLAQERYDWDLIARDMKEKIFDAV